jgi:hypothetical protein
VAAANSIDLDMDPRSIIGSRVFNAPRDLEGLVQTMARHAEHIEARAAK